MAAADTARVKVVCTWKFIKGAELQCIRWEKNFQHQYLASVLWSKLALGARKHNCTNVSSFNYVPSCFAHWKSLLQLEQVCEPLPFSALFYLILLFGALLFLSTFLQFCFNGE